MRVFDQDKVLEVKVFCKSLVRTEHRYIQANGLLLWNSGKLVHIQCIESRS